MDAGVKILQPVAGIAMGLITEGADYNNYVVLSDILGEEDHLGDMDFKVAGTKDGITAFQMDIKIAGVTREIMAKALSQAKEGRMHILGIMNDSLNAPREDISEYAPKILTIKVDEEKIGAVIGTGGKTIKELVATYNVKINTEDDGRVTIAAQNMEVGEKVEKRINELTAVVEVGKIYKGKITRIEDYGVFVEILNGSMGLLHISEISHRRIRNIKDVNYKIGQFIDVKVIGVDRDNRIKVSKKAIESDRPQSFEK